MAESRRSESTEESKDDDAGKINGLQIAAASGAASTGALVAHALGIYGTVAGVALFSVVSSVGTVLYLKSIHRTRDKLRKVVKQVNTTAKLEKTSPVPAEDGVVTEVITRQEHLAADTTMLITRQHRGDPGAADVTAHQEVDGTEMFPADENEEAITFRDRLRTWWKRYWKPVTTTSVAAFVLSLTILTGIAWVSGQPPTQYYNGNSGDSAPAPQPTQPADEDTFDDAPPSSQPEEPEDTVPSPESSQPQEQEPSPEGDEDSQEQPQEPSTQPDDPDTTDETPEEPEDEDEPQQQSVPSHDSAVTR